MDWRLRVGHAYGNLTTSASAVDPMVARRLLEVINLIRPPDDLWSVGFGTRVLLSALRAQWAHG
jgi:hypothetical protein